MHPLKEIKKVFNIKKTAKKEQTTYTYDPYLRIQDMAFIGYHGLYRLHLHFSVKGIERWQKYKKVRFPKKCCFCNQPQETQLTIYKKEKWYQSAIPYLLDVPHCQQHGQAEKAKLIVKPYYYYEFAYTGLFNSSKNKEKYKDLEQPLTSIVLFGANLDFLRELVEINTQKDGDFYPPWIAFKNSSPFSFKQGIQESWFTEGWYPFKGRLGNEEYVKYLHRWNADEEWIEHHEMCVEYQKRQGHTGQTP